MAAYMSSPGDDVTTPQACFDHMNLSAISSIASDSCISEKKESMAPSFCEPFQPESKARVTYTQTELDTLYNSYVQWTYLNASLEKRRHEDERSFMAQSNILWRENERLRAECAELDEKIAEARYLNNLETMLKTHDAKKVVDELDQFASCHSNLAKCLDTTRHQLPLEGVHISTDTDTYSQMLTETLQKSLSLMQKLAAEFERAATALEISVAAAGSVQRNLNEVAENLQATSELTNVMTSLTIQESSLSVQKIMSAPVN